jgi:hypothetical protein
VALPHCETPAGVAGWAQSDPGGAQMPSRSGDRYRCRYVSKGSVSASSMRR